LNIRLFQTFPGDRLILTDLAERVGSAWAQHDQHVIQMNEVHRRASEWVQRGTRKVLPMIGKPGHPTGNLVIA
jgi:hypothetical protein